MANNHNTRPVDPDASTKDLGKTSSAALPEKIGHYSIKSIIASGGMGTVYLAQQEQPRRVVALKIMKKGIASKSALRRFEYESQILARLKHPNVAQVYEAGTHDDGEGGVPFFAMEYIANAKTIIEYAKLKKLSTREQLAMFAKVCDAVYHGHQKGIIHRDLKPGNILVDSRGEPKIIDFGVARATDSDMAITTLQTDIGQLIGTLQYMSPEQCDADPHDLDTRSDVYALGVVLYELLSESLPYDLSHIALHEAARVIREETPAKPSTINKTLRGDVETITLKALEKDRERRYATAADLGRDIQHYINNEPIEARPASAVYLLRRFAQRHRAAVGGIAAVFVVLVLATIVSVVFLIQANRAKSSLQLEVTQRQKAEQNALNEATAAKESEQLARESEQVAIDARLDAERQAYVANIYAADAALKQGNMSTAKLRLSRAPESLRNWEWFYYTAQSDRSIDTFEGHEDAVDSVAFSPDGRKLASASWDKTIKLWKVATGEELATLNGHEEMVRWVEFSPDGQRLVSASDDKTIKLWDVATGEELSTLERHGRTVYSDAFSPDGQRLVSVSYDETIKLWEVATGEELITLEGNGSKVLSVYFSPDGQRLASGSYDSSIKLWDVDTGEELVTLEGHDSFVYSVVFSPDGQRLASGSFDNTIKLWDVAPGKELDTLEGHEDWVYSVVFSPDGQRLASASLDQTIKLWDVVIGEELATLKGHKGPVRSVAYSPDGQRLASASFDDTIKIWDMATGEELFTLEGHEDRVNSVAFSLGGRRLASGSDDRTIKLWDVDTGEELATLVGHEDHVYSVAFLPDGRRLASASWDNTIKLWDVATGDELDTAHGNVAESVVFSPDGLRVATSTFSNTIMLWDVDTRKELHTLEGHEELVRWVEFSPDGQRLASASDDKTIKLWDVATGEELLTLEGHEDRVNSVAFSPDGQRIASGSYDHTIKLWDSVSNAVRFRQRNEYLAAKSMMEPIVDRRLTERDDARHVANSFRDDPTLTNLQRRAALNILLKRCDEERLKKQTDLILEQIEVKRRRAESSEATANDLNSCALTLLTVKPADLRDPPAALTFALRACELTNFKNPAILDTLALAYHLTGDHAKAVETLQNALDLLSPGASGRGDYEAALARYEEALKDESKEVTHPGRK